MSQNKKITENFKSFWKNDRNVSAETNLVQVSTHCMINRESVVRVEFKIITRGQVWRLFLRMSKFEKFILSHSKQHRTFSEVCKDVIADTMRLYFMLRHSGLSRGKVLECVCQLLQELRVFLAQQEYPISTNCKAIFGFIWIWILCHGSCSHFHTRKLTWAFRM